ncbi:MAG TPA: PD-(D/E)XK motif protein [Mycobacteriales bacterium]|nr:PD-(D/E)XK motif protein [Mycobacteriales bacterium]
MSTDASDLESRWTSLPSPAGSVLEAERLADWAGGGVLVAIGTDQRRHLLVEIASDPALIRVQSLRGLSVAARRMRIGDTEGSWLDVELSDPRGARAFSSLCVEIVEALSASRSSDPTVVMGVIDRWRRFWGAAHDAMRYEDVLGLFGELWLLLEWLPELTGSAVAAWRGPLGGRHDFVTPMVSVEVKTTGVATGPVVHRIGSLAQLDEPGEGQLYLLSLRIVADPLGHYSLDAFIERARNAASDSGGNLPDEMDSRLAAYGWTPKDAGLYSDRLRVVTQHLYRVDEAFPRLTPRSFAGAIPDGVQDLSYTLDTSACRAWLVESGPARPGTLDSLAHPI